MANNGTEVVEFSEKNLQYVERLLYDVLSYTLPICGFPEKNLPTTDCEENSYKLPNFIESAGATVLTRSLAIRNKLPKHLCDSILLQENNCGFDYEYITVILKETLSCFHMLGVPVTKNILVEVSLAFCNETVLFIHHERLDIDFNKLIKSASKFIVSVIELNQDVSEITDELFFKFDNISLYTHWITNFIAKLAVPYRYKDDVPKVFKKLLAKLWQIEYPEPTCPDTPFILKLKNPEEFSSHQVLSDIAADKSISLPGSLESESVLPDYGKSPKSPILPESSESVAFGEGKSCDKLSTRLANVSDESSQSGQSSKSSEE